MHYLIDFCRFCLTFDGDFHNMSLGDILEKANTCIGDFEFYRSLPNLICTGCLETLDKFFDFRNRCLQSELVVHRYVQVLTQNTLTNAFVNKKLGPRLTRSFEGGRISEESVEKVSFSEDCNELKINSIRGFRDFEHTEDFQQIGLEKVGNCDAALPLVESCSFETLSESAKVSAEHWRDKLSEPALPSFGPCSFVKLSEPVPPLLKPCSFDEPAPSLIEPCSFEKPPEPTYAFNHQSGDQTSIINESIKENNDGLLLSNTSKEIISEATDNNIAPNEETVLQEEIISSKVDDCVPNFDNNTPQIKIEQDSSDDKIILSGNCQKYNSIVEKDQANLPTSNNRGIVFQISNTSILAKRLLDGKKLKTHLSPKGKALSASNPVKRIKVDLQENDTHKFQLKTYSSPKRKLLSVSNPVKRIRVDLSEASKTDKSQSNIIVDVPQENDKNKADKSPDLNKKSETFQDNFIESTKRPPRHSPMCAMTNPRKSDSNKISDSAHSMCITKCETKSQCNDEASSATDFENAISLHHILSTALTAPLIETETNYKPPVCLNTTEQKSKQIVKDNPAVLPIVKTKDSSTLTVKDSSAVLPILPPKVIVKGTPVMKRKLIKTIPIKTTDCKATLITNKGHKILLSMGHNCGTQQGPKQTAINLSPAQNGSKNSSPVFLNGIPVSTSRVIMVKTHEWNLMKSNSQQNSSIQALRLLNSITNESIPTVQDHIRVTADTHNTVYKLNQSSLLRNKPITLMPQKVSATQDTHTNITTSIGPSSTGYVGKSINPLPSIMPTDTTALAYTLSNKPIISVPVQISVAQNTTNTSASPLRIDCMTNPISPVTLAGTVVTSTDVSSYKQSNNEPIIPVSNQISVTQDICNTISSVKLLNPISSKPIPAVSVTTDSVSNTFRKKADDEDAETPRTLDGQHMNLDLLPAKSRELYENNYLRFMNWRKSQNVDTFSENILIKYLTELSATVKPSTLWSHYSMLKATLHIKHGVNIKSYSKLTLFLKNKSCGYQPKTSKTLTKEQISKFLEEAPDHKYLMTKVCLMLGVAGGLRREQLVRIQFEDVTELNTGLLVKVYDSVTKRHKTFKVSGDKCLQLYRKYTSLRPPNMPTDRFFIKYRNGKCHRQVVGIHKIAAIAQEVARYLRLPDLKDYTGHCLKKTSTEMLVNAGMDRRGLRRRGKTQISISTASTDTENTKGSTESSSENSTSKREPHFTLDLLPEKSREVYEHSYARFMNWRETQNVNSFSEDVIIDYFSDLSASVKPSTLWSHYSMVRATVNIKHGIDIKEYTNLFPFLKSKSRGYQPTKSKAFTREQVNKFLSEAPDEKYLMTKVALMFGVAGALRRDELPNIKFADITELDKTLSIKIQDVVTKKAKSFTISGDKYVQLYKKYSSLRPTNLKTDRFFIKYRNGTCYRQVVGIHKLATTAYEVANYLHLPHLNLYTGHSLRKTSAEVLKEGVYLAGVELGEDEEAGPEFSFSTGLHIPESVTKEEVELDDLDCILDGKLDFSNETVPTDTDIQIFKTDDW
ncbi:uncharacterized protein LOC116178061 isoform X3 [Photinus pyralis]|uniref:uncharacterized protein LOC116178061 isoform X3 n=1 Tax=Photinus pyralis TaxID=7054 RepID=UPI00126729D0|nr:uncharacterized protein LOC116178061 isoform X3 [Photinus pyralis]